MQGRTAVLNNKPKWILWLVLAGLAVWFFRNGDPPADRIHYSREMERLCEAAFAPIDSDAPDPTRAVAAFAGICRDRVRVNEPDAVLAQLSLALCRELGAFIRIREQLRSEIRGYEMSPPSVLKKTSAPVGRVGAQDDRTVDEQKRRKDFYIHQVIRNQWDPAVQRHQPPCMDLLDQIKALEKQSEAPRWVRIQRMVDPLWQAVKRFWARVGSGSGQPAVRPATSARSSAAVCRRCHGHHQVDCPRCAGFGRVNSDATKPCRHCKGAGRYQQRLGASTSPCPFCRATGKSAEPERIPCPACKGTGQIPCPDCNPS